MKLEPLTSDELAQLNPGIRHTVQVLRGWNFRTTDSGDGATHDHACDLPVPYVHIAVPVAATLWGEMIRLRTLLRERAGIELTPSNEEGTNPTMEGAILADDSAWIHLFNVVIPSPENVERVHPPTCDID